MATCVSTLSVMLTPPVPVIAAVAELAVSEAIVAVASAACAATLPRSVPSCRGIVKGAALPWREPIAVHG